MDNTIDWAVIATTVSSTIITLGSLIVSAVSGYNKRKLELDWERAGLFEDKRISAHKEFVDAYCNFINSRGGFDIAIEYNKAELFKLGADAYMVSDSNARNLINEMLQAVDPKRLPNGNAETRDPNLVFWEYLDYISAEYDAVFTNLIDKNMLKRMRKNKAGTKPFRKD